MRIDHQVLREAIASLLLAGGVDEIQCRTVAANLAWCDMVGRRNHGLERLPILLRRVGTGAIRCPSRPHFEQIASSSALLFADRGFGHHAAELAIARACDLAFETGIGIVGVRDSNFYGAGAYYVNLAAERGMIGLALSNSFPKVAPPGGTGPALGTNPFSFGVPRRSGRAIIVDMSTASVAGSTIREAIAKGETLADGIAIDRCGNPVHDPAEVAKGTLLPAAGGKGLGLAVLVEVLSAVLTGAGIGGEVGSMYKDIDRPGNNGHFLLALDPSRWMPPAVFHERVERMASVILDTGPVGRVRLPGELRWAHFEESLAKGVEIDDAMAAQTEALAQDLGIQSIWRGCHAG
ncbi:MAG TPA: Ldh family oxidoreductase [Novosphingobium sp.]|nr:Ldh family oxidoreductase [Novosphingobium sp.]